jgi:chromosomal replication initiation ATPase DnaA
MSHLSNPTPLLIAAAADLTGIAANEITGPSRAEPLPQIRWAIIAAAVHAGWKIGRIAPLLNRDHSSATYALRRVAETRESDPWLRHLITRLQASLNS